MYTIIKNASEIATPTGRKAIAGKEMDDLRILRNMSILIEDSLIKDIDTFDVLKGKYNLENAKVIDAQGKCLTPGFVDSHTHFIFGGYRENEYEMRLQGKSYVEIMQAGGGILSSVKMTGEADEKTLVRDGLRRLDSMLSFGVTTVEGKSGYGLDKETELRQLRAYKKVNEIHPIDVVRTFLGAHSVPAEYKGKERELLDFFLNEVMPIVKEESLSEFVDIFTEKNVFSIEDSEYYLAKSKEMGFSLKMHADEIFPLGGAELAARLGAVSADHLLKVSENGMKDMAANGVVATLLPLTAFSLKEEYAPARKLIDSGNALALATDMNPGSCFSESIPLLIALATLYMGMTTREVITALTLNGAAALGRANEIGSIEIGKKADIIIHEFDSYKFIPYHFGVTTVERVIKGGTLVYEKGGRNA